jgi:hypothetical protein
MPGCGDGLYRPGHNLHWIQTKKAGSDPLAWFPATVIDVEGEIATVRYDDDGSTCRLWRHGGFASRLRPGDRASVCERWHVLQLPATGGGTWVCIEALDAAPKRTTGLPADRLQPFRAVPVDMSTGEGHP